jgi:hypothetical protein
VQEREESMRIRNRSSSFVFSVRGSCEKKAENRTFTDEVEDEEEKYSLPMVAAAMGSQQAQDDDTIRGSGTGMRTGIDRRRGHKWRDILLRCTTGNPQSCGAINVDSWEGENPKFKGHELMRNEGDKIGFLEDEGKSRGVVEKENISEKAGIASDYRECDSPKSGQFESDFMSRKREHEHLVDRGEVCTINSNKRRRTKKNRNIRDDIDCINAWRSGDKKSFTISEEEQIIRKEKTKALEKPMTNTDSYVGSQCRRRNGRGWRCSQRTLVGYSLCEHHLGKGRLKSINSENGTVFINNNKKVRKFKELRVLDASSS